MKNTLVPILLVAVLCAVIALVSSGARRTKHYDEMQLKIRADGYRLGYTVTLIALFAAIFLGEFGVLDGVMTQAFADYAALMLGIAVFAVYCIWHEAFFSVSDKSGAYIVLCVLIVLLDGFSAVSRIMDGSVRENGVVTFESGNSTLMTLLFLAILIALLVKRAQLKREDEE